MKDRIQFVTFAGGANYVRLADRLIDSINKFCRFPVLVTPLIREEQRQISALHKPAIILAYQEKLECEFTFFADADMEVVAPIQREDILPKPMQDVVAVQHFFRSGYDSPFIDSTRTCWIAPERRGSIYWQTCFFGGRTNHLLQMLQAAALMIWTDRDHAGAFEEPYLNCVFNEHRERLRTLPCTFAAPTHFPWRAGIERTYRERAAGREPVIAHRNYSNPKNRGGEITASPADV